MKSLIAIAALAGAAAIAAPASAQSLPSFAPITYNAGLGFTGLSQPRNDLGGITLRAGANFGKYFGLEGEGSFGVMDSEDVLGAVTTKVHLNDQYAGYAVARVPLLPNANILVRGGYGHVDIKVSGTDLASGASASATGGSDSWNYGVGGEYLFDGKNGVRVDYTRFDLVNHGARDIDSWTVSYVRRF